MKTSSKLLSTVIVSVAGALAAATQAFADAPSLPDSGTSFIVNSAGEKTTLQLQPHAVADCADNGSAKYRWSFISAN